MATEPITTNGPTITVSNAEELASAYDLLSYTDGGGTILLEPGDYGSFSRYPYGVDYEEQPVVMKSVDPENPAEFTRLYLREVSNIRIENIYLDGTENIGDRDSFDVTVQDTTNIQIVDSVFVQDVDNVVKDAGGLTDSGIWIRDSDGVLFQGNYLEGQFNALQVQNTTNTDIIGNEFTDIQGDGFRGGGLQNVTIADNYMHDFYVVNQHITHTDMIQVWGSNSYLLTENLTISGNTLIASDGATQGIFIRNEEFGIEGDSTAGYLKNITVSENLIYNGHLHGIRVDDTDGVLIDSNTVLWNPDAWQQWGDAAPVNWEPIIRLQNSLNTEVTNNITSGLNLLDSTAQSNNQIVTYDDSEALSYVGNHFVDPLAGADVVPQDLFVLSTSSFYGVAGSIIGNAPDDVSDGAVAKITATVAEADRYEVTFDASGSTDMEGTPLSGASYTYHWTFHDGTIADGISATQFYTDGGFKSVELEIRLDGETVAEITRNVGIESNDIFAFDFEDGVIDISDASPGVVDNGTTVDSHDGAGFLIGDGNKLEIDRWSEEIFGLDSFGLALDLTPTGDEQSGTFLHLYQTLEAKVLSDGRISFSLTTDEGTYSLNSNEPIFDDGEMHRIGIAFDGNEGRLELFADGESVSVTEEAWGTTPGMQSWGLVMGNTWNNSIDAIIDNVEMSHDPELARLEFQEVVETETPPTEDPPTEDPPVEDPPAEDPPSEDPPAEDPPSEDPPAEDPPAEDPPAEDPPAEDPPAEDPPAEDPPAEEEEPRGKPKEAVESDDGGNFLSKIFDMFLKIFGGGGKGNKATEDTTTEEAAATYDTTLADIMPITEMLEDDVVATQEEDDELTDLAA